MQVWWKMQQNDEGVTFYVPQNHSHHTSTLQLIPIVIKIECTFAVL